MVQASKKERQKSGIVIIANTLDNEVLLEKRTLFSLTSKEEVLRR